MSKQRLLSSWHFSFSVWPQKNVQLTTFNWPHIFSYSTSELWAAPPLRDGIFSKTLMLYSFGIGTKASTLPFDLRCHIYVSTKKHTNLGHVKNQPRLPEHHNGCRSWSRCSEKAIHDPSQDVGVVVLGWNNIFVQGKKSLNVWLHLLSSKNVSQSVKNTTKIRKKCLHFLSTQPLHMPHWSP